MAEAAEEAVRPAKTSVKVSRVGEMVLAIIGGIFGLISGIMGLAVGGAQKALGAGGTNVAVNGTVAILFSILALVAAFYVSSKSRMAGWMLVVSAIGGIVAVSAFYILPGILLMIAGLMCLFRGRSRA